MQLKPKQIEIFKQIHKKSGYLSGYTEAQVKKVATSVANYYLILFNIRQENKKEDSK